MKTRGSEQNGGKSSQSLSAPVSAISICYRHLLTMNIAVLDAVSLHVLPSPSGTV